MIRPNKILMIKKNFIEFSFDVDLENEEETIPDFKKFKTLNSAEQYYLADNYNWDDGPKVLQWIVDSSNCDKGTACLIFWRAEPDYYFDYTSNTVDEYEKDIWLLLQSIITFCKIIFFKSLNYTLQKQPDIFFILIDCI